MNFILLSEIIEEETEVVTETAKTIFGYPVETVAKFGILILIVAAISVWFILRPTDEKKKLAQDYLTKMATQIMNIAFANMSIDLSGQIMQGAMQFDYKTFKEQALKAINDDSWEFAKASIKYAVDKGELDPLASRLITEESVAALVKLVMGRPDMEEALKNAYRYITETYIKEVEEEDKKAKQLAAWAEAQPAESGGEVPKESIEILAPDDPNPVDDSIITEPIFDPSVDPDTVDDDGNSSTKG